jgi:hypothetical protein
MKRKLWWLGAAESDFPCDRASVRPPKRGCQCRREGVLAAGSLVGSDANIRALVCDDGLPPVLQAPSGRPENGAPAARPSYSGGHEWEWA